MYQELRTVGEMAKLKGKAWNIEKSLLSLCMSAPVTAGQEVVYGVTNPSIWVPTDAHKSLSFSHPARSFLSVFVLKTCLSLSVILFLFLSSESQQLPLC